MVQYITAALTFILCCKKREKVSTPLDKDGRDPSGHNTRNALVSLLKRQPYFSTCSPVLTIFVREIRNWLFISSPGRTPCELIPSLGARRDPSSLTF